MAPKVIKEQKWAYGWHWRYNDHLSHCDGRTPQVGQRLVARDRSGRIVKNANWCRPGFHAAPTLSHSLDYCTYGKYLSFVLMEDCRFYGKSKFVARSRTILWQRKLPQKLYNSLTLKKLEAWLKKCGFKAENARAKAIRLRNKFPKEKKK